MPGAVSMFTPGLWTEEDGAVGDGWAREVQGLLE